MDLIIIIIIMMIIIIIMTTKICSERCVFAIVKLPHKFCVGQLTGSGSCVQWWAFVLAVLNVCVLLPGS